MWRKAMHGKDDALRLMYSFVERLPIAPPSDDVRAKIEPAVMQLIDISRANVESQGMMIDWLRTEFDVDTPGMRLEDFARLDEAMFLDEVRKRRPKKAGIITPSALKALREAFIEYATPIREHRAEAAALERTLSDLVNQAYGLTIAEVALLWDTAPPRMPISRTI